MKIFYPGHWLDSYRQGLIDDLTPFGTVDLAEQSGVDTLVFPSLRETKGGTSSPDTFAAAHDVINYAAERGINIILPVFNQSKADFGRPAAFPVKIPQGGVDRIDLGRQRQSLNAGDKFVIPLSLSQDQLNRAYHLMFLVNGGKFKVTYYVKRTGAPLAKEGFIKGIGAGTHYYPFLSLDYPEHEIHVECEERGDFAFNHLLEMTERFAKAMYPRSESYNDTHYLFRGNKNWGQDGLGYGTVRGKAGNFYNPGPRMWDRPQRIDDYTRSIKRLWDEFKPHDNIIGYWFETDEPRCLNHELESRQRFKSAAHLYMHDLAEAVAYANNLSGLPVYGFADAFTVGHNDQEVNRTNAIWGGGMSQAPNIIPYEMQARGVYWDKKPAHETSRQLDNLKNSMSLPPVAAINLDEGGEFNLGHAGYDQLLFGWKPDLWTPENIGSKWL